MYKHSQLIILNAITYKFTRLQHLALNNPLKSLNYQRCYDRHFRSAEKSSLVTVEAFIS